MRGYRQTFTTPFRAIFLLLGLSVGPAFGQCAGIEAPPQNVDLEAIKADIVAGQYSDVFAGFEISDEVKANAADQMKTLFKGPPKSCVTIRRSRPSENWINEILMLESTERVIGYFVISGTTVNSKFRMLNFKLTINFTEIRELVY